MVKGAMALVACASVAQAQAPVWGQCGGQGWSGPTTCVSGATCQAQNQWYSQCLPGSGSPPPATTPPTAPPPTTTPTTPPPSSGNNSPGCGRAAGLTSGTHTINGRQFILRLPNNYSPNRAYRLIFGLHWLGGNMGDVDTGRTVQQGVWNYYGLQRLADNSAIFVAPQGNGNGWGNGGGSDVNFINSIITYVEDRLCINQQQRFSVGFSFGGAMSYALACAAADKFRAVAVLSGGQMSGCSGGNGAVAYLGIHGIRDGVTSIAGGRTLRDRFVRNNGCQSLSPREPTQGSLTHVKTQYSGCRAGYPVTWIAFDEGHIAAPRDGAPGDSGTTWTSGEIWQFFSQF
ncbi:Alpha/Beta hydrolase protein [Plectosphaerella cucumerina]|uniref:Feruloyl esterase C n=1 Tax=Plectosphaerella cucumerina TaxID=40658 RepID=A0A8K0TGN5_9PEZI|nr:Alpha/Beta hydrolase protein [Plectosphaerella cucumerina]